MKSNNDNSSREKAAYIVIVCFLITIWIIGALLIHYRILSIKKDFSSLEIITIVLLCVCFGVLVYLWKSTRKRIWYFGILPERLFRQQISLEARWKPVRSTGNRGEYYVVLPLESISTNRLPIQMYEGESELVVLHPLLQESQEGDTIITADLQTRYGKSLADKLSDSRTELENFASLHLVRQKVGKGTQKNHVKYLSIEIVTSGFEISGDKLQRQLFHHSPMSFTWGITAKSSGRQKIAFVFKAEDENQKEIAQISMLVHEIRVASIARLNHRQVKILMGIVGTITTVLTILEALQRLGIL